MTIEREDEVVERQVPTEPTEDMLRAGRSAMRKRHPKHGELSHPMGLAMGLVRMIYLACLAAAPKSDAADTIAALKADVEHWKGIHASACVSMIHYVPAFGVLLDAITILGKRAIAAEAKCVELEGLLKECFEAIDAWPGDLDQRCRAALPQPSDTQRDG